MTREGTRLLAQITGQAAVAVYPWKKDGFFYTVANAQLTFERDEAGVVNAVILNQDGRDRRLMKADPAGGG